MKQDHPSNTAAAVRLETLIRHKKGLALSERMSSRMVRCASVLGSGEFLGWQMYVPKKGLAEMTLFGSQSLREADLQWIAERTAKTVCLGPSTPTEDGGELPELYELRLPAGGAVPKRTIGFGLREGFPEPSCGVKWPLCFSTQFPELLQVLRITGALFRAVLGSAEEEERLLCGQELLRGWDSPEISPGEYIGRPVRARFLLRLPGPPSVRLRTVLEEAVPGIGLHPAGRMDRPPCRELWQEPLREAAVLPDYASRILLLEPAVRDPVVGVASCEEPVGNLPLSHKNPGGPRAIALGRAVDTAGTRRRVLVGETDLKRHYQIVGQTGTGKSTLLTHVICDAVRQGYGLTFFDPHGSTVDALIRSIPAEYAGRVRVVRIGNAENPVPLSLWDSGDLQKEERNISDLCELFSDIFDPHRNGFVGPRYERWLSTFAKASIALLGRSASLESIAVLSQNQANMRKLCKAILPKHPELAETIRSEYATDKSTDFQNTLNWYLCKFQRLTCVEQLRKTLGAGANALDFQTTIDTDTVTLIDLASPEIGTHAARILGTLLMMKLWNAAMTRRERDKTHLVAVDEAALFQTNPMPRMLAESRKFGLSMILCHQHTGQLTAEIRDALESNSANFSSFRLSPRDAVSAAIRLDAPELQVGLARLDAFRAVTTLSVQGRQTAPFTLEVQRPRPQRDGEETAAEIERRSRETLVEPYRSQRALTPAEILQRLERAAEDDAVSPAPADAPDLAGVAGKTVPPDGDAPEWLERWNRTRQKKAS